MTLTEFLLARIAEDEAIARAASPGPWHTDAESTEVQAIDDIAVADGFALSGPQLRATTAHIAHWDPARGILATCTAKRRLLALHGHVSRDGYGPSGRCDDYLGGHNEGRCSACVAFHADLDCEQAPLTCPTLQLLAMPYADHPDYDPSWQR